MGQCVFGSDSNYLGLLYILSAFPSKLWWFFSNRELVCQLLLHSRLPGLNLLDMLAKNGHSNHLIVVVSKDSCKSQCSRGNTHMLPMRPFVSCVAWNRHMTIVS